MKILISGIHGFVGTNLTKSLKTKHLIYGLDIITPKADGVEKTYLWNDIDSVPFHEFECIIHLAGKAHDTKGKSQADTYFEINTGLTKLIFDKFLENTKGKFIFFSSVKAATEKVTGEYLTEDIIPTPKGAYGESKIKAEEYILSKSVKPDQKAYIFRPCMIHGPGNKGNLNLLYNFVKKGIPYPLGSFDNMRSFTSIDNLAFIIDKVVDMNICSGIYNISDDEALSTNKLIQTICSALGKKTKIWRVPKAIITGFAKIGDVFHLPLNSFRLNKLTENYVVNNEKIKKAIEISHLPISSTEGLTRTIKSFK
jgi:nucleoside-diphosphate-sugar epimerase